MPQYVKRSAAAMKATTHIVLGTFPRTRGRSGLKPVVGKSGARMLIVSDFSVESPIAVIVNTQIWIFQVLVAVLRRSK